ncbi:MAG: hypothetical protein Q8916_02465 [Bacteroidota bacterium]|nr:hypothetical protein [Bacteroidota bacterium]MDP4229250.1 hypothetical protein [Bacteroidota bacterium]MDP4235534.1 hypothetical protein [Bacteroidota bacterium]
MRTRQLIIACMMLCAFSKIDAQTFGRIIGAGSFEVDDGTRSGKTLRWDVASPLSASYMLHFPSNPPTGGQNFLTADGNGNMNWATNILPPLPPGNMWCGNEASIATPMAPGTIGSILGVDVNGMPEWLTTLPNAVSVSASQITSGTLQPGTAITVGNGSSISPSGTGLIVANRLGGSGVNKYSGTLAIPLNALSMNINYSGVTASSTILVSIIDPSGQTAQVSVANITAGIGFAVIFSGYYPTTTGSLNYIVIN